MLRTIKKFFQRNRKIHWTPRGLGITFALTLCLGIVSGQVLTGWVYPESYTTRYTLVRIPAVSNPVPSVDTLKEESVNPIESGVQEVIDSAPLSISDKIRGVFAEHATIALAVARAESGLDQYAIGYNCYYYRADGTRYSTSCKYEDRQKAWSVDCGIFQINHIGKSCPESAFDVDDNISLAKKMVEKRGWTPWVTFMNKQYLNHM